MHIWYSILQYFIKSHLILKSGCQDERAGWLTDCQGQWHVGKHDIEHSDVQESSLAWWHMMCLWLCRHLHFWQEWNVCVGIGRNGCWFLDLASPVPIEIWSTDFSCVHAHGVCLYITSCTPFHYYSDSTMYLNIPRKTQSERERENFTASDGKYTMDWITESVSKTFHHLADNWRQLTQISYYRWYAVHTVWFVHPKSHDRDIHSLLFLRSFAAVVARCE